MAGTSKTHQPKQICYSISAFHKEFNFDRRTLSNALANTTPTHSKGRAKYFTGRQFIDALINYFQPTPTPQPGKNGTAKLDARYEDARKSKEQADKLALENARTRQELIHIGTVTKIIEDLCATTRSQIESSKLTDHDKDKILNNLRAALQAQA